MAFAVEILVLLATMIFRRAPKRVTLNSLFWTLAFFVTYWPMLIMALMQRGYAVSAADVG